MIRSDPVQVVILAPGARRLQQPAGASVPSNLTAESSSALNPFTVVVPRPSGAWSAVRTGQTSGQTSLACPVAAASTIPTVSIASILSIPFNPP